MLTLRMRHEDAAVKILEVSEDATVADLQEEVAERTGVATGRQLLTVGNPPMQLSSDLGDAVRLLEVGICNHDTVIVKERSGLPSGSCSIGSNAAADSAPAPKRRKSNPVTVERGAPCDPRGSDVLPAFDRAIAAASKNAATMPEDKHQVFALRKGKAAVIASLNRGDNISLSAMHTLTGVGHWVVEQVREHLTEQSTTSAGLHAYRKGKSKGAPPPSPADFQWWYLNKKGKPALFRNDAEMKHSPTGPIFKVSILHASGRLESGWLPDSKAPPEGAPPAVGHR